MKVAIVLLSLFSAHFCFSIVQQPVNAQVPNLGFHNYTRKDATIEMMNNFTAFVNVASSTYLSNVASNALYIKQQMDAKYGDDDDKNFYIFIQTRLGQATHTLLYHPHNE